MRTTISLNRKWAFRKNVTAPPAALSQEWDFVNLPHTWNGIDGQDGEGDFWRGTSCYVRPLAKAELPAGEPLRFEVRAMECFGRTGVPICSEPIVCAG